MKTIFLLAILIVTFSLTLIAQESPADLKPLGKLSEISQASDTVKHKHNVEFTWGKNKEKSENEKSDHFNGHWEGIEIGFNGFDKPNYSMYSGNEFMSLNQGKSSEFDFNFYELNIGLASKYVGLVSGMGLSFNSYRFENPYTIERGPSKVEPVLLSYDNLQKTKLAVSYLTVPVLLEFQIPVNKNEGILFMNAGIIGGVKLGSHTKVKHGDIKDKDRDGFNLNQFKYSATARVGFKGVSIFANYSLNTLFKTGKGPELTPFTIGISFLD